MITAAFNALVSRFSAKKDTKSPRDQRPPSAISWHCSIADKFDRLPHVTGSMMKYIEERGDLIVMNAMRFELQICSGRATSEKTYAPAFRTIATLSDQAPLSTDCLDYTIGAAMAAVRRRTAATASGSWLRSITSSAPAAVATAATVRSQATRLPLQVFNSCIVSRL